MVLLALAPLLAATMLGGAPAPESPDGRFVFRTLRHHGAAHAYAVWHPPGFPGHGKWPAILFLHGSGESGVDGEKPTRVGIGPALTAHPERWPFVVVFPQKTTETVEWEEQEELALAVLADAVRKDRVDAKRVVLAGMSQGGHGTWTIGARNAGRFVGLVPVCGYGRARTIAPRVARLPVWAFHGLRDDVVDPADTRNTVAEIRNLRSGMGLDPDAAHLTLFPDANHNSWDPAFASDSLHAWLHERLGAR